MLFGNLFHVAIRAANLDASVRFYTSVMGMVVADRPPIGFPGAWLKPAQPGADASIHLYGGDSARELDGSMLIGTGSIDHVSVQSQGYGEFKDRFIRFGLPYRENLVPKTSLWQLFVYDPSGVQLELTFHSAAETIDVPNIFVNAQYQARERWFDPTPYGQFLVDA
jgi:catechol 2,3-dioxygenase-like lactoylglutathione lyase family enzyme